MSGKKTKKRNNRGKRSQIQRKCDQLTMIAVCAFLFLCIGSFASMALMNSDKPEKPEAEQWYVEDGDVEILAAPMAQTLDGTRSGNSAGLPFMQAMPTAQPAIEPAATEIPRATPMPLPTEAPVSTMEALVPEVTLEPTSVPITITAVGDCTLGGNVPSGTDKYFDRFVQKYGYDYFLENVRELFESDDLTIVNLEGTLTTSNDRRTGRGFNFRGKPEYVKILSGSSVEIANVANNHAYDFGASGFKETVSVLRNADIGACGFGEIYMEEVKGVKVCSLGFTEWEYDEKQITQAIKLARPNCDLLIVNVHWGKESRHEPLSSQRKLGKAMVDAGADIVIGNHSHVYGGIELYKDKYIIYSLGNFCFGGNTNPGDRDCTIFQQTFVVDPDGSVSDGGISIIPARVCSGNGKNNFQPYIQTGEKGAKLVKNIAKVSYVNAADMKWMETSYQVKTGMVTLAQ